MDKQGLLEKKLQAEIDKNQSILEDCVDAVITVNHEGIIEFFNKAAENLLGYNRVEALGKNVKMLTPPEYRKHHDIYIKKYLETHVARVIGTGRELNAQKKDGSLIPILLTLSQAVVDGKYIFTAFIKDYTEKKKYEEELKKLSLVASKTDNTVIITNRHRDIEWVNEGFTHMTGYRLNEVLGKNPRDFLQGKDTDPEVVARMRNKFQKAQAFTEVILNYKKNGEPYWVNINITPILDQENQVVKYIAIESDITKQKKLQESLRENEKRLIETQQIAGLGTWEYDLITKKVSWSAETFKIFGLKPEDGVPDFIHFIRLIHKDDRDKFIKVIREIINNGIEYEIELKIPLPDGSKRCTYGRGRPIFKEKRVVKILGALLDITERKRIENQIKIEKERAEASSKAKEMFLANTSHEIRTPMNAIIGITEILKKTNLTESQSDYLGIIENSAENLLYILNDILDISKIESGKLEFEQTGFRIKEVIKGVLKTSLYKAKTKGLELTCNCPGQIGDLILIGDPVRINQILLNLVNNAIKFTDKGSVTMDMIIKNLTSKKAGIRFLVKDTGIGIPEEKQKQIFEEFEQADTTTTRKYGGTGLGLSISRKLVEMMGGRLKVKSKVNKGSTFSFELSLKLGSEQDIHDSQIERDPELEIHKYQNKRILIVDDQEFNLLVATQILESYGFQTDTAFNGKEALKKVSEKDYDLILMDIQMPGMDGVETTAFIREHLPPPKSNTPIVALTAHAIKGDREKYLGLGLNNYLSKPFKKNELLNVVFTEIKADTSTFGDEGPLKTENKKLALYDLSQIVGLSDGNHEFVVKMINSFLEQIPGALAELKEHTGNGDYKELAKLAHKHKTSFAFMGITSLFEQMVEIEEMAKKHGSLDEIQKTIDRIEKKWQVVKRALKKELRK